MKAITIKELDNYDDLTERTKICIDQINGMLKFHWAHRKDGVTYYFPETPYFGMDAFIEAKKAFLENGIDLEYYQPHRMLSFKVL